MGKTSAEMSIESGAAGDHNVHHPADTLLPSFLPTQGNEQ
jgi:NADP-dependent alcohol dehydrogenase